MIRSHLPAFLSADSITISKPDYEYSDLFPATEKSRASGMMIVLSVRFLADRRIVRSMPQAENEVRWRFRVLEMFLRWVSIALHGQVVRHC